MLWIRLFLANPAKQIQAAQKHPSSRKEPGMSESNEDSERDDELERLGRENAALLELPRSRPSWKTGRRTPGPMFGSKG